jgi:hypothetical protein
MITATGASYSVYLCNDQGERIYDASAFLSLRYARTVNAVGAFTLVLPATVPDWAVVAPDGIVEIWRRPPGGQLVRDTETIYQILEVERSRRSGSDTLVLRGDTPLRLLDKRFIDDYAGGADALLTGAADNVIKAIVRAQAGSGASAARQIPGFTVTSDASAAPSITKGCAWDNVLSTIQKIAQTAAEDGTYVAFDVVCGGATSWTFDTYTGQRGADRRAGFSTAPVIFSTDNDTLVDATLTVSYRDEITYAKAGGQGEGSGRLTGEATDAARADRRYGRLETFVNATQYSTTTGLSSEAAQAVRAGRPRYVLTGSLRQHPNLRYGIDWGWGDYVTAEAFGVRGDARVETIEVEVADAAERIGGAIRLEGAL